MQPIKIMASFISSLDSRYGSSIVIEVNSDSPRKRRMLKIAVKRNEAALPVFRYWVGREALERGRARGDQRGY